MMARQDGMEWFLSCYVMHATEVPEEKIKKRREQQQDMGHDLHLAGPGDPIMGWGRDEPIHAKLALCSLLLTH